MRRIHAQVPEYKELAIAALSWISSAVRPLAVDEMKEALAIQVGDKDLNKDGMTDESLIVSVSAGLISIDKDSRTIRLVHATVAEFFKEARRTWLPDAESLITETCLTYLSFDDFQVDVQAPKHEGEFCERWQEKLLLWYAAPNWGLHVSRGVKSSTQGMIVDFLKDERKTGFAGQAVRATMGNVYSDVILDHQLSGLHLAAHFGLEEIAQRLLASGMAVNQKPKEGSTALAWAVANRQEGVVRLLLDQHGIEINSFCKQAI